MKVGDEANFVPGLLERAFAPQTNNTRRAQVKGRLQYKWKFAISSVDTHAGGGSDIL